MKAPFIAVGLLLLLSAVAAAQSSSPLPALSMMKRSADGKTLELQKHIPEFRPETYTVQVPVTISEEVDGVVRTRTVYKTVQQSRMVGVTKTICIQCALDGIEVRNVEGGKYDAKDIAALFTEEFAPVIVVERQKVVADGKAVVRPVKFDKAYLKLFKPETLIVFLPPEQAASRFPPGFAPPSASPTAIPTAAPSPVPAPSASTVPAPAPVVPRPAE